MTFKEAWGDSDTIVEGIDAQCQPKLDKVTMMRRVIMAKFPEVQKLLTELDSAYMDYSDHYAECHVDAADKHYRNKY